MATADRSIYVRLGVRDADRAVKELEAFGARGSRAVQSIETATRPASRGLLAVSAAAGEVRQSFGSLVSGAGRAGSVLGAIGPAGLAAAAGIGAATVAFRAFDRAVAEADALVKFADNVGVNVEVLQEFRFAAARSGIDAGKLDSAIGGFNKRLGEAKAGTGELLPVLEQYNIQLVDAAGNARNTEQVIGDLADVIQGVTDPFERARIGALAFGRTAGVEMLNLLRNGRQGIQDLRDEARRAGVVLEEEFTREAEKTRDALDTFGEVISTKVNRALLTMAPLVTSAVSGLSDLIVAISNVRLIGSGNSELGKGIAAYFGSAATGADGVRAQIEALSVQLRAAEAMADRLRGSLAGVGPAMRAEGLRAQIADLQAGLDAAGKSAEKVKLPASPQDLSQYNAAIAALREQLDPLVKIERERAEALAKVAAALKAGAIVEAEAAALRADIAKKYDEERDKVDGTTEALKRKTAAQKDLREETKKAQAENERVVDSVNNLRASYDRSYAALRQYNDEVALLDHALDRGLVSEREHADLLAKVEEGYRRAKAEAASYGAIVQTIPNPSARALSPVSIGSLVPSIADFGKATLATGKFPTVGEVGNFVVGKVGGSILDNLFAGNNPLSGLANFFKGGDFFSGITNSISSGLAQIAPGLGTSIAQALGVAQGLGPAGLLTGGLGPGGAGGAVAAQVASGGLAQAGFAAAAGPIAIAVAGAALVLLQAFGGKKSSGPALGATFNVDDGGVAVGHFGADNKADPAAAKALGDAVVDFVGAFLQSTGAKLLPGSFRGEVGFESGRFANSISSPGLTEGDRRSGRSPDLRTFGSGDGAAERATADFAVRSLIDALDRGLVEGLSASTADIVRAVLGRIDRDGGPASLEAAGEALDFATGFEDATERMMQAGNAAALQLLDLADGAKAFGDQQKAFVEEFRDKLVSYFGQVDREVPVPGAAAVDGSGRVRVDSLAPFSRSAGRGEETGFSFNGADYVARYGERGSVQFENTATGALIDAVRGAGGELLVFANTIGAVGDAVQTIRDFGDPGLFQQGMDALGAYVDNLLGLTDDLSEPLTGAALRLEDGLQKIEAMRDALTELGLSAEVVADKLSGAEAKLRERVARDFDEGILGQIVGLKSPNAAAILAASAAFDSNLAEAKRVGGDEAQVRELYELQLVTAARQAELQSINEAVAARSSEISALEQVQSAALAIVRQTQTTRENIRINPEFSQIFTPTGQLDEALRLFDEAVAAAKGGDEDAARRANDLATTIIQLGQAVHSSTARQTEVAQHVDRGLAAIVTGFQSEADVARSSLDELRGIRQVLSERLNATASGSATRSFGTNATRNRLLADLFPEFTGDFGGGLFSSFFAGVSQSDPRRSAAENIISTVAFAEGGDHIGGYRLVGERGPELEKTGAARIHSAAETTSILRQALSGGGETPALMAALLSEFRGLRATLTEFAGRLVEVEAARASRRYQFGGG